MNRNNITKSLSPRGGKMKGGSILYLKPKGWCYRNGSLSDNLQIIFVGYLLAIMALESNILL